jgi:hypothetical protein
MYYQMLEWLTKNWNRFGRKWSCAYRDWGKHRRNPVTIGPTCRYLKREPLCNRGLLWINFPLITERRSSVSCSKSNCPQIDFLRQMNQCLAYSRKIHLKGLQIALFPSVFNEAFCSHPCMLRVTFISLSLTSSLMYINYVGHHSVCFPILLLCLRYRYSHHHATFEHCEFHVLLFQWEISCLLT